MSDEQKITVAAGGPYLVSGGVPVTSKTPVMSEHGEPLTWKTDRPESVKEKVALCRCGASSNKPFCDGSHASIEWDGSENAPEGTYGERAKSYGGDGIEVFDDRPMCVHAGFCGNQVTNVWKMAAKTDDSQVRAQAMAMIERCPSGALTYAVDGETIEPDLPVEVAVIPDGPLWVSGGIEVTQSDGTKLETRNRVTLCRCGQSASKPLCDGSHKAAGFIG
ncbi:MAG: CDGSH-type Zn-finger protein [Ilumatobacter sp.]|jgi:CDGSH-type Zn-finger protein|tara:strand:+ start:555 stop:1214 length:660 start_codon:yes stop_codon:yes gene_type:complete